MWCKEHQAYCAHLAAAETHLEQLVRMLLELDEELAAKFRKAVDALVLLRKLEWLEDDEERGEFCPSCRQFKPELPSVSRKAYGGHAKDCELRALLEA